jgi:hypothetical protein
MLIQSNQDPSNTTRHTVLLHLHSHINYWYEELYLLTIKQNCSANSSQPRPHTGYRLFLSQKNYIRQSAVDSRREEPESQKRS